MNRFLRGCMLFCAVCFVQSLPAQKFSASLNAQLALPQGEYKQAYDKLGYGLRGNVLFKPVEDMPLKMGLELGILEKARYTEYFTSSENWFYDEFEVSASLNIFSLMFVLRAQPALWKRVKPFVDITAGGNLFFSAVNVERLTFNGPYTISNTRGGKSSWAMAYGGATGADISLDKNDEIGLEIKLAYLAGNNTFYLANPFVDSNAEVHFEKLNSRTNMLVPQIGVRFILDP